MTPLTSMAAVAIGLTPSPLAESGGSGGTARVLDRQLYLRTLTSTAC